MKLKNQQGFGALLVVIFVAILVIAAGVYLSQKKDDTSTSTNPKTSTNTSNTSSQNSNQPSFKACDLIAATEVSKALGETYTQGRQVGGDLSNNGTIQTQCSYGHDADKVQDIKAVTIMIKREPNASTTKTNFESGKTTAPVTTALPGYGDEAYWSADAKQMSILKGNYWVLIVPDRSNQADAKKLATLVLSKLP